MIYNENNNNNDWVVGPSAERKGVRIVEKEWLHTNGSLHVAKLLFYYTFFPWEKENDKFNLQYLKKRKKKKVKLKIQRTNLKKKKTNQKLSCIWIKKIDFLSRRDLIRFRPTAQPQQGERPWESLCALQETRGANVTWKAKADALQMLAVQCLLVPVAVFRRVSWAAGHTPHSTPIAPTRSNCYENTL